MPKGILKKIKEQLRKVLRKFLFKRKYTRRANVEVAEPKQLPAPTIKNRTVKVKEEILDTLDKFHVQYFDKDGHIAIRNTQMLDQFIITELLDNGVQVMNAKKDEIGAYIALYY